MDSKITISIEDGSRGISLAKRAFEKAETANRLAVADGEETRNCLVGKGVLRRIRSDAVTGRLPIVILTSSEEGQDLSASYDLGDTRKPVLHRLVVNQPPPNGNGGRHE